VWPSSHADVDDMNHSPRQFRRLAAVAIAVTAAVPAFAGSASAASFRGHHVSSHATGTPVVAASSSAAPVAAPAADAPITSVTSIGGYVFYNMSYLDAVAAWEAAVAAAPAGYTPPTVYSVSATTTVSGTVEDPNGNG
jgi:hypothetical protein